MVLGEVSSDTLRGACPPLDDWGEELERFPDSPWCLRCSPMAVIVLTPFGNRPSACRAGWEPGCGNRGEGGVSRCGGTDGWKFSLRWAYVKQKAVGPVASHTVSHWALNTQPQAVPPPSPWELCVCWAWEPQSSGQTPVGVGTLAFPAPKKPVFPTIRAKACSRGQGQKYFL